MALAFPHLQAFTAFPSFPGRNQPQRDHGEGTRLEVSPGVRLFAYRGVALRVVLEEWYEG
jgi:hypothetical protein